ncbi:M3 family oligoendopeptidase [Mesobacillus selenatarsenatis]|uniref:M3 family oligoendopeptidase n=1 Tax=Mesobacillus selenatarsenatis TaxID=388741 RepID=A0A846T9D2_9BACI|nr:M3 family oligoendopeptidase [Mesobacillus selenatarsenatis]NKE05183.1 M3 family oligoendopeptidase [Mesobacillus selenatarsenatis]
MSNTYSEVWDLDVFFEGGSASPEFAAHLKEAGVEIDQFKKEVENWQPADQESERTTLESLVGMFDNAARKVRQAGAFVSCLHAQNTNDKKAGQLKAAVTELSASLQTALTKFDQKLSSFSDSVWSELVQEGLLQELRFVLTERRERAAERLSEKEESVINALSVDGYHGWGQMYDLLVGNTKIDFNGESLSVGQAANKLSNADRSVRKEVFAQWEKAWGENEEAFAKTLNHLAGFRLNVYKLRGWEDVLKEPLDINRMKKETLDAMWEVISDNKEPFVQFLNRKAKLLGLEKLSWYDLDAPIGSTESKMSYQEGADFIVDNFEQFGKENADFARMAFENNWIEAEDRPGKAPGGFHTFFPESSQSRIFMTYSGTPSNVSTLAHELGHGFHTYAMRDLHLLNRNYAMNVAETASTFAEMIVSDASVKNAKTKEEKLSLLEDKIQRSVALLMNIHSRFLFETKFYEERKEGVVTTERLGELMKNAQTEAYGGALEEYHPLFWASKLHFFITGVPFYNFPYTFGYLFSLGIYALAQEEGKGYEEKYIALLKDSASMTVEDLAQKHLNVDLTKKEFWEKAVRMCVEDVEEFIALIEE